MFNAGVNENLALFLIENFTDYFCAIFLRNDVKNQFHGYCISFYQLITLINVRYFI